MFASLLNDCQSSLPILGWAILALLVLIVNICSLSIWMSLGTCILGFIVLLIENASHLNSPEVKEVFHGALRLDSSFYIFNCIGLVLHLGVVALLIPGLDSKLKTFQRSYEQLSELLICILFSGFGFSVLAAATDLVTLFLGLETLSIGVYCLCGFYRTEIRSTESALKYLLIGAFSTVLFLYGLAFLYGASGATHYTEIRAAMSQGQPFVTLGIVFLVSAFAFKLAFVPFHFYAPEVYEGAPTPITAYLATVIKVGVLAAALRLFWEVLEPVSANWTPFWLFLCVISILLGNILALQQQTLKKLLAYSSISHSGFLGLALFVSGPNFKNLYPAHYPLIAYLVVYSAMSLGLFAIISLIEDREKPFLVKDLSGLAQNRFFVAILIGLFVLGLAGLPPFAGFMVKFWVLEALVQQNYVIVAVAAVVGSLIGAAYYLRILMLMFMSDEVGAASQWISLKDRLYAVRFVIILTALLTLLGGMRPQLYADWILTTLALK